MEQSELIADTMALWPRLAAAANLAPEAPEAVPLHFSSDARAARVVLALAANGRPLIVKREHRKSGAANDRFARSVIAQKTAHLRLAGNLQGLRAPEVLAFLPEHSVVLMERLKGEAAAYLVETAPDRDAGRAVLAACGRWLGEFHRASRGDRRLYQTRFVMDHFRAQRVAVMSGQMAVAETGLYLRLSRSIEAVTDNFNGLPAMHAQRHGDYNMRNVLIDESRVGAIDFAPEQSAPVGHDIVRLLVDYATLYGEHSRIPEGQLMKRNDLMAFLRAYDLAGPEDASIGFLMNTQLLAEWAKIPAQEDRRSLIEMLRLQGLVETALRMFPALRSA